MGSIFMKTVFKFTFTIVIEPLLPFNDLSEKRPWVDGPFVTYPSCYCFMYVYMA